MTENAFIFLRATFFRWAKTIEALLPTFKGAPVVLSVGDAHLENFGTWRDSADRLVWGVNDFDDASVIQYPFDLVRLCTSALLVPGTGSTASEAAAAILTGYVRGLAQPRPTLVSDADGWMQSQLAPTDKSERRFWKGIDKEAEAVPPVQVQGNLTAALPPDASVERFASRRKGGGGLGRPRYLVIAVWRGQRIAREAKAAVPSAWDWAHRMPEAPSRFLELARGPYRSRTRCSPSLTVSSYGGSRPIPVRSTSSTNRTARSTRGYWVPRDSTSAPFTPPTRKVEWRSKPTSRCNRRTGSQMPQNWLARQSRRTLRVGGARTNDFAPSPAGCACTPLMTSGLDGPG